MDAHLLERVRHRAGLSQAELASLSGTSRTTISAYEHGRKSPTLATASRLLATAGFELTAEPKVTFTEVPVRHGRPAFVGDRLWRIPLEEAFAEVTLPLGLNWSTPGAVFTLADRRRRARCYEIVLREGSPTASSVSSTGRSSPTHGATSSCHASFEPRGSPSSVRSSRERPDRLPGRGRSPVLQAAGVRRVPPRRRWRTVGIRTHRPTRHMRRMTRLAGGMNEGIAAAEREEDG